MIEISKREYPYPVLAEGRDDYSPECKYHVTVNIDETGVADDYIKIPLSYELTCQSLEEGIKTGEFVSAVKIRSSAASFCEVYIFEPEKTQMTIEIPKYNVAEKIELTGLVMAGKNLEHFSCDEMNEVYFNGMTFSLRKGDAVAMDVPKTIYVDDSELEKPIVSIFTINYIEGQKETLDVSYLEDKICINLNEELNKMYWALKDFNNGALRRYVTAIIVIPALIEAIDIIKRHYSGDQEEDYSELRWFRAIEHKAEKRGYKLDNFTGSSAMLADILLGNISLDALKSFKDMLDQEMNSGETQMIGGMD